MAVTAPNSFEYKCYGQPVEIQAVLLYGFLVMTFYRIYGGDLVLYTR